MCPCSYAAHCVSSLEIASISTELETLKNQEARAKSDLATANSEFRLTQHKLSEKESHSETLRIKVGDQQLHIEDLQSQLSKHQAKLSDQQAQFSAVRKLLETVNTKYEDAKKKRALAEEVRFLCMRTKLCAGFCNTFVKKEYLREHELFW